ncbi:hypothetical protein SLE2022_259140 [Rubroshorea leprosula]
MASISQSILMALTVTVNKFASSNVHAVHRKEAKTPPTAKTKVATTNAPPITAAVAANDIGRRGLILSTATVAAPQFSDSRTELLKKYLKKSEENKVKNDKERLDSYYKRNYKDYFEFVEGAAKGKKEDELTESEKGILDWLKSNK